MRAVIYVRQSQQVDGETESTSLSLQSQERAVREWCERQGWEVVEVCRDHDLQGWRSAAERPGLAAALALAERRMCDVVAVFEISRLARKLRLQEEVIERLGAAGVRLESVREPWVSQPLFRQVLGAVAEESTRMLRYHTTSALRTAAVERGHWQGGPPYGYARTPGGGPLTLGPEYQREIVIEVFRRFGAGEPLFAISADLNRRGVPTMGQGKWYHTNLYKMVRRDAYRGYAVFNDVRRADAHPVFVPPDVLAAADARIAYLDGGERAPRAKRGSSWLEGLVRHECGRKGVFVHDARGGRFKCSNYPVACRLYPTSVVHHRLDGVARGLLTQAVAAVPAVDDAVARARADWEAVVDDGGARAARLAAERAVADATARMERLARLAIDRDLPPEWYDQRRREIQAERQRAELALSALPPPPDGVAIAAAHAVLAPLSGSDLVLHMDGPEMRALLSEVGRVYWGPSGIVLVPLPAFAALIPMSSRRFSA